MADLTIGFTWTIQTPLHVGTGLAQAGYVDRLVSSRNGAPYLSGDAVKGAIRGSAERLYRWLVATAKPEDEQSSLPQNQVLRRLFAPQTIVGSKQQLPMYRFPPASCNKGPNKVRYASTAIDPLTGTAKEHTLRVIESWVKDLRFDVQITARGGRWDRETDLDDLRFLLAAVLCTDSVGGKRGVGFGRIHCGSLTVSCSRVAVDLQTLASEDGIARLQKYLRAGETSG